VNELPDKELSSTSLDVVSLNRYLLRTFAGSNTIPAYPKSNLSFTSFPSIFGVKIISSTKLNFTSNTLQLLGISILSIELAKMSLLVLKSKNHTPLLVTFLPNTPKASFGKNTVFMYVTLFIAMFPSSIAALNRFIDDLTLVPLTECIGKFIILLPVPYTGRTLSAWSMVLAKLSKINHLGSSNLGRRTGIFSLLFSVILKSISA